MERLQKTIFLVVKLDEEKRAQQQEEEDSLFSIKGKDYEPDSHQESSSEDVHYNSSSNEEDDGSYTSTELVGRSKDSEDRRTAGSNGAASQATWGEAGASGPPKCEDGPERADGSSAAATRGSSMGGEDGGHAGTVAEPATEPAPFIFEETAFLPETTMAWKWDQHSQLRVNVTNMDMVLLAEEKDGIDGIELAEEEEDGLYILKEDEEEEDSYTTEKEKEEESDWQHSSFFSILGKGNMPTIAEQVSESRDALDDGDWHPCVGINAKPDSDDEIAAQQDQQHPDQEDCVDQPRDHHRPPARVRIKGSGFPPRAGQLSTFSAPRLRGTFRTQSTEGEELYEREQYAMAVACFNDARLALLILAGLAEEGRREKEGTGRAARHARFRDQMNSALLSERITDCHVQKSFHTSLEKDKVTEDKATAESDFSHINYHKAATMILDIKTMLRAKIEERGSGPTGTNGDTRGEEGGAISSEEIIKAEINDLNDLLNEATLSSARILTKQGCVSANFGNHFLALGPFGDSIAAWEEAANIKQRHNQKTVYKDISTIDEQLIVKTHDMICSDHETHDSSRLSSHSVRSLKNTIHLKALSTALQMARSHHVVAVEAVMARKEERIAPRNENLDQFRVAVNHHLHALKLICETRRLRAASNKSSLDGRKFASRFKGAAKKLMAANKVIPGGGRLTTHGRDLGVLKNQSHSKDIVDNVERFMKRCTMLIAQQQVCISHACSSLGHRSLSTLWLLKASDNIDKLEFPDVKEKVEANLHITSLIKRDNEFEGKRPCSLDRMSLYEGGLSAFVGGCNENPRLFVHYALAVLQKGLQKSAMAVFLKATEMYDSPTPPGYYDELLHAINAQIIIKVEEGDMDGAVKTMHRRLDVVSKWIGNTTIELADDLHRLGCFYSILGHHERCARHLEDSLLIGAGFDDYDTLDSIKFLATTYDAMSDTNAIKKYVCALSMEEDIINKARLINALSHLLITVDGQSQLAVDYLDNSLSILQGDADNESTDPNILLDTMVLYGDAMASEIPFSQAIAWYELALRSNPEKSVIHPINLRAWYNKGVTLFRNGDTIGAAHAFGIIIDEVDKSTTTAPSEAASVLNAIGSIYFEDNNFAGAIECFTQSLSLKKGCFSLRQRAGTFCNIGSAYYRMQNYKESEKYLNKALKVAESLGETSSDLKATIMCKLAYILYMQKHYSRAHTLFSDAAVIGCSGEELDDESKAASMGADEVFGDEFNIKCESYAIACYLQLKNEHCEIKATTITNDPTFDGSDTTTSAQENGDEDDYAGDFKDDEPTSPKEENTAGLGVIVKALSRFISVRRASQKEEVGAENDKDGFWQDEPNSKLLFDPDDTNLDINSGPGTEDNGDPEEVATGDTTPVQKQEVTAQNPMFDERLIPIIDEHSATRYSSAVYPWNAKMLRALGIKPSNCNSVAFPSEDRTILCNKALEYLLRHTDDCRAKYALQFEGLLVEESDSNFMTMKSLLDNELHPAIDE